MSWKFWEKPSAAGAQEKVRKLPKPKDIETVLGRTLVVDFHKDPDWVWTLKSLERPRPNEKTICDVRVFNQNQAHSLGVSVRDYNSLDDHPELILFEGWYDKKTAETNLKEIAERAPRAA